MPAFLLIVIGARSHAFNDEILPVHLLKMNFLMGYPDGL